MFSLKSPERVIEEKTVNAFSNKLLSPVVSVCRIPNCRINYPVERNFLSWCVCVIRFKGTRNNLPCMIYHKTLAVNKHTTQNHSRRNSKINNIGLNTVSNLPITCGVISKGRLSLKRTLPLLQTQCVASAGTRILHQARNAAQPLLCSSTRLT
jgi:hypothetical protein